MRRIHEIILSAILTATVLSTVAACADDEDNVILGGGGQKPVTPPSNGLLARMEVPATLAGNDVIAHWDVIGGDSVLTYCLEYDRRQYHSRWVAFRFDGRTRSKLVARKDYSIRPQYPADPQLPTGVGIENDASFNGYQHGHLCASADRLYSRTANDQTFYMTNMSPMLGDFNSNYWVTLEGLVQKKGRDATFADTLYVVKGGTITENYVLKRVASGRIVVPKYYYMALLKVKNGNYSAIAFWMEHKRYGYSGNTTAPLSDMKQHALSVDRLEELTGIDFFHNLPDVVEQSVETQCFPSAWGLQ